MLNDNICEYISNKIIWKSFSNKNYVQHILELVMLENYIRTWTVNVYFQWFTLDYLMRKYKDDYHWILKELKWSEEADATINMIDMDKKIISNWINFESNWELNKNEDVWIKFWGIN
jgi:hypothetical protein